MMLERGHDDLVPFADALPAEGLGHEVDRLGRAADEHDLAGLGGIHERSDLLTHLLVGVGRLDRECVHAAVDVRVGPPIHVGDRLDDGLRLLSRCRVVEVDERVAVNLAGEDREAAAEGLDVEARAVPLGGRATREDGAHERAPRIGSASPRGSRRPSCASTNARRGATRILEATSLAKA